MFKAAGDFGKSPKIKVLDDVFTLLEQKTEKKFPKIPGSINLLVLVFLVCAVSNKNN